jgi:pyridoxine 5-phosphate synthase
MIQEFQRNGIRTSIFVDPHLDMIEGAKQTGTDHRTYTGLCAWIWFREQKRNWSVCKSSTMANELGLGINAGQDLVWTTFVFKKKHSRFTRSSPLVML